MDGKVLGNANQTLKYLKEHRVYLMIPSDMDINKGVELILKGEKTQTQKQTPKFFDIKLSYLVESLDYRWI